MKARNWLLGLALISMVVPAQATITGVNAVLSSEGVLPMILTPDQVVNSLDANLGQQGFDERQGVLLAADIEFDSGFDGNGMLVDSHMIFLNEDDEDSGTFSHNGVEWTFSGEIIGVMSDGPGNLEEATTELLGNLNVFYPDGGDDLVGGKPNTGETFNGFPARGMENNDSYVIAGNVLTVNMAVTQPGDWIRVVTKSARSVPEPATLALLGVGLAGFGFARKRVR